MEAERAVLQCGDCETLLKSAEEAQQHAKNTCHTNFRESNEAILTLVCTVCRKTCTCKTESDYHTKRTGHAEFQDRTEEAAEEEARRVLVKYCQKLAEAIKKYANYFLKRGMQFLEPFGGLFGLKEIAEFLKAIGEIFIALNKDILAFFNCKKIEALKMDTMRLSSLPVSPATKAEQMSECLWTIKQNHMDDEAKVKTAFNTLLTFAKNVATNPDEEKYRKIRLSNALFQDRVGKLQGGIEFLELCGFERIEGGEFLYLQREKVDMDVLYSAGNELNNAIMYDSYIS
ncbi:uncharacterized protein LOC132031813 [Lycium ferocissimum]|uniref:uncharacterized protein LOC132031813 n=1 Tax=Lycium ferocissimum TaxID=112874 RepID=UPI002814D968|nr:uncharacterized protein LOC132031813 [Lycium ferocissimum]